ncbi:MAG: hypothetical protein Q4G62_08780 [Pseudomonadota bacterium]|nr:hypothetical protein [Pseudomonadota bacterium]
MHPVLVEVLQKPVGWLLIGVMAISIVMPFVLHLFIKKKMREEERGKK